VVPHQPLAHLRTQAGRPLSESRKLVLSTLVSQPEPTSITALTRMTGLHANTLREHLAALERQGLVSRRQARTHARGRPGWLYVATRDDLVSSQYAGLAAVLAAVIHRTSAHPAEDARAEGIAWGRRLAVAHGDPDVPGEAAAQHKAVEVLDEMGFAAEPGGDPQEMRLTRCPLLEAAHRQTDVVCAVHLGIAEGLMAGYGYDAAGTELVPFAQPGACVLRLHSRPAAVEDS
jgi:predicted ArsR family transcriptional regulator